MRPPSSIASLLLAGNRRTANYSANPSTKDFLTRKATTTPAARLPETCAATSLALALALHLRRQKGRQNLGWFSNALDRSLQRLSTVAFIELLNMSPTMVMPPRIH